MCTWQDAEAYLGHSELLPRHQHLPEFDASHFFQAWWGRHDTGAVTRLQSSLQRQHHCTGASPPNTTDPKRLRPTVWCRSVSLPSSPRIEFNGLFDNFCLPNRHIFLLSMINFANRQTDRDRDSGNETASVDGCCWLFQAAMLVYFRSTRKEPLFICLRDSMQLFISAYKERFLLTHQSCYNSKSVSKVGRLHSVPDGSKDRTYLSLKISLFIFNRNRTQVQE